MIDFDDEGSDRCVDVVADLEGETTGEVGVCCGELAPEEVCETDLFAPREIKTGSTEIVAMDSKVCESLCDRSYTFWNDT